MNEDFKIIRDPLHGNIKFQGIFLSLIEAPELQRLYDIKQLGFAHLVFPGAHHTRLEHSLGTYNMALQVADVLKLDDFEKTHVAIAGLLHDIGHGPFSHTLESLLRESLNVDHVDLTKSLIFGEHGIFEIDEVEFLDTPGVYDILLKYDIDIKLIGNIVKGDKCEKKYLGKILNNSIDIDQLDYLIRDSYYTGVAYGMIDVERFLQTLLIKDDTILVEKKGVGVIENILMARALMYTSVYFHKTVRIAELMLSKAIDMLDDADPFEFFKLNDAELISYLKKKGKYQHEIVTRLKYRKLFKQAYVQPINQNDEVKIDLIERFNDLEFRRIKEKEIEDALDIPHGHVIIDVPRYELHLSEPRIDQTDIMIYDNEEVNPINKFTPIANAIKKRSIPDWDLMIISDEEHRKNISQNVEKILYN